MSVDKQNMISTEHQNHGKELEWVLERKIPNLVLSSNHTDKWDATINNIPVSIKCCKWSNGRGGIGLGSIFRQADVQEDFYLIVAWWVKSSESDKLNGNHILLDNGNKKVLKIDFLYIPYQDWVSHFNSNYFKRMEDLLNSISNRSEDDALWRSLYKPLKKEYTNNTDGLVSVNFKRDHKTQKRVQCSINYKNYKYFYENFNIGTEIINLDL